MAKVANPRFATLKYLAIFSIFCDFLLRSYINSLMIFENGPIFVSTESVLRKFAQTLKKKGNEWAKIQLFFAPFIYKFLNDLKKVDSMTVSTGINFFNSLRNLYMNGAKKNEFWPIHYLFSLMFKQFFAGRFPSTQ